MHNVCWQFFKKSGSIEAYLYINNRQILLKDKGKREKSDGNSKYPGHST
ncbi:hypothetical protein [Terrisporobacter sp.]